MGSNRRNAANILKGEKEILHYYLTFTENNLALLEMNLKSFTVATQSVQHTPSSYVTLVLSKLIREKPVPSLLYDSGFGILAILIAAILSGIVWFKHTQKMHKKKNSTKKVKCS